MSGQTTLALQTPALAWSQRAAAGQAEGLKWADPSLDPSARPLSARAIRKADVVFQAGPVTAYLPASIATEAWSAQAAGEPTAWEGLQLLLARPRWLVASRPLVWTPASPEPCLLASLVEACGVGRGVHRDDPDRLRRLAALLPSWRPHRGTAERAAEVLSAAGEATQMAGVVTSQPAGSDDEEDTAPSATAGEVFACRGGGWWASRMEDSRPALRVSGGLLRFQPRAGVAFTVRREDVLAEADPSRPLPRDLYRLLPVWCTVRAVSSAQPPRRKE